MSPAATTLDWVENFVIRHALCPFAAQPFRNGAVTTATCTVAGAEESFFWALAQVQGFVTGDAEPETTLLVFPDQLPGFTTFLDVVYALEDALEETGADNLVQLAHFHPDYRFAGAEPTDPGNRTNRSPYPVIQLLRVDSVAAAVSSYPDVEAIPARNVQRMHELFGN